MLRGRGRGAAGDGEGGEEDELDKGDASVKRGIEKMMSGIEKAAAGKLVNIYGVKTEKKEKNA